MVGALTFFSSSHSRGRPTKMVGSDDSSAEVSARMPGGPVNDCTLAYFGIKTAKCFSLSNLPGVHKRKWDLLCKAVCDCFSSVSYSNK